MDYTSLQNILKNNGKVKSFVAESAKTISISISTNKWINKHNFENEKANIVSTIITNPLEWLKDWFPESFEVFSSKRIKQVYVSKSVEDFKEQLKIKFDLYDYNNYEDDSNALRTCPLKKDEAEFLTSQDVIDIARIMSGYYWEESHSNTYTDDLWDATDAWRIKKEKEEEIKKIKSTTDKDLPLLLNTLKYDESKKVLEKRFKGTK